jgi:hypothetical protein
MFGEPSSPATDQPRRGVKPRRDLGVVHAIGGVQHDPRALHRLKRQLLRPRSPLEHGALIAAELNAVTRRTRHHLHIQCAPRDSFT